MENNEWPWIQSDTFDIQVRNPSIYKKIFKTKKGGGLKCWFIYTILSNIIYRNLYVTVRMSSWAYHSLALLSVSQRSFRNYHTMPFSSCRRSKASQRCVSHGELSISTDEMATWKNSQNISPSPSLIPALYFALPLSQFSLSLSVGSMPLKQCMKCITRFHCFAPSAFWMAHFAIVEC